MYQGKESIVEHGIARYSLVHYGGPHGTLAAPGC